MPESPFSEPTDPFADDPLDPAAALPGPPSVHGHHELLTPAEQQDVLDDLTDLDVYEALLSPRRVLGLVVDCDDCRTPHFYAWELLRANLRHLLESGENRVHEPAFDPDPHRYVSWEYARGYADGMQDAVDTDDDADADAAVPSASGEARSVTGQS